MNRYYMIGLVKYTFGDCDYRIADITYPDKEVRYRDIFEHDLKRQIEDGEIVVENLCIKDDKLHGTHGMLSRYGILNADNNNRGYKPLIVISNINNLGYRCVDINGNVLKLRNEDLYKYVSKYSLANAKYKERLNSNLIYSGGISGLHWDIPMDDTIGFQISSEDRESIEKYKVKAKFIGLSEDIGIDDNTGTIYRLAIKGKKIIIPNGVKTIESKAIKLLNTDRIDELTIPKCVENIESKIVETHCGRLHIDKVVIPDSIKIIPREIVDGSIGTLVIGENAPEFNYKMQSITDRFIVDENNKYYTSVDGILYSKDKKRLLYIPEQYQGDIVTPVECEKIDCRPDWSNCKIGKLDLSKSNIKYIDKRTFEELHADKVIIKSKIIGRRAFAKMKTDLFVNMEPASIVESDAFLSAEIKAWFMRKFEVSSNYQVFDKTKLMNVGSLDKCNTTEIWDLFNFKSKGYKQRYMTLEEYISLYGL